MLSPAISYLCQMYCELNSWMWPEALPGKPEGWDEMRHPERYEAHREIFGVLARGLKEYDKAYYWNVVFAKTMDEATFAVWWEERGRQTFDMLNKVVID